jgi:hypothetical protein
MALLKIHQIFNPVVGMPANHFPCHECFNRGVHIERLADGTINVALVKRPSKAPFGPPTGALSILC